MTGKTTEEFTLLMECQKKYGKRGRETKTEWILRKRTINIGCTVVNHVRKLDFEELELQLYFKFENQKLKWLHSAFEGQMEDASLDPEKFIANLDSFYQKNCNYIEESRLYREFYDFCKVLEQQRRIKAGQGNRKLFDAYLCLLMQQSCYFCKGRIEDSVVGIANDGELMYRKNPHPYSDLPCYDLERKYPAFISGKKELSSTLLHKIYKPYGYDVNELADIGRLEALVNTYDNNSFSLVPYINDRTKEIIIEKEYQHFEPEFPRQWKLTEFYKDKLSSRNYMLPATGVTAEYVNAGDILKILFMELVYDDEIIMLYRIFTMHNGELTGYFQTKSQTFYSIYEFTNQHSWHNRLENFILENYMMMTCDYEIDKKKNYALRQVDELENAFHYPYQPLVKFTCKSKADGGKKATPGSRRYVKEGYQDEICSRSGYIRNLPENQHASDEAKRYAAGLGLNLPEGKTFVRAHEFHIFKTVCLKK